MDTSPSRSEENSPAAAARTSSAAPPSSSCIPLASAGLDGIVTRPAMIVPSAQAAAAPRIVTTPTTEVPPEWPPRPDSSATPASPSASPASCPRPSRAWFSPASMPSSHSGTVATSSAASPDGTVFSPTPTTPLATSSKMPTIAHPAHSARVGQRRPSEPKGSGGAWTEERGTSDEGRRRLKATRRRAGDTARGNMIRPATRFRTAAISSGGMVWTPTLMAR